MRLATSNISSRFPGGTFFIHSIRNPLTSLQLNLDEIKETKDRKRIRANINNAQLALNQINELINSIPHSNSLSYQQKKANIEQTVNHLKSLYQRRDNTYQLIFNLKLKSSNDEVRLNQLHFYEVLSCLINNGFDSYHPRTKNKVVVVTIVSKRKRVHFQVQDFGKGVNQLEKILMTNNGYSKKREGFGFGMWFVKQIVEEQKKGKLRIISEKGQGTLINFSLSLA